MSISNEIKLKEGRGGMLISCNSVSLISFIATYYQYLLESHMFISGQRDSDVETSLIIGQGQ